MVNNIQILKANICDLKDISKLEETLEHSILSPSTLVKNIEDEKTYILVAKSKDKLIAYTSFLYLVDHIDIESIVVDNDFRHQGIASSLLEEIFKTATTLNITELFLEVRESNTPAIKLYEKNGFKNIHIRKNYYPDNLENALIYKKELA